MAGSGWIISFGPAALGWDGAPGWAGATGAFAGASGGGGRFCCIALVTLGEKPCGGASPGGTGGGTASTALRDMMAKDTRKALSAENTERDEHTMPLVTVQRMVCQFLSDKVAFDAEDDGTMGHGGGAGALKGHIY